MSMASTIKEVKEEVHQMKGQMGELMDMKQQLQDLSKLPTQMTEIRNALLGTEFNENNGLVKKVDDHEKRIVTLESAGVTSTMYFGVLRWLAITIGAAVITGIVGLLFLVLKYATK